MGVNEIFSEISKTQVQGMMLHNDMADYYDFLDLHGFKRMHEYHFLKEAAAMRGVHRYFINHYNMLMDEPALQAEYHIPKTWHGKVRQNVDGSAKKTAIKNSIEKWADWERHVKTFYEEKYSELCSMNEIAAAMKVKSLIADVDQELKGVDRLHIELASIEYDLPYIFYMQDSLHESYKDKEKGIGVDVC